MFNDIKIPFSKDSAGNVTFLIQIPIGVVDANGNSLDPAYRFQVMSAQDVANLSAQATQQAQTITALQTAIDALPIPAKLNTSTPAA
jgi:hypothetical protein